MKAGPLCVKSGKTSLAESDAFAYNESSSNARVSLSARSMKKEVIACVNRSLPACIRRAI